MKITFLNGRTPAELKENYPNSMFLEGQFDTSIIGINGLIDSMIEGEYPEVDPERETFTKIDDKSINGIISSPPYKYRKKQLLPRIRCIISKVLKN